MYSPLKHALQPPLTRSEGARQRFAQGYRSFVMNELASDLKQSYEQTIRPAFERAEGHAPQDGTEVRKAMLKASNFPLYNAVRVNAQKMVWETVAPPVRRTREQLQKVAKGASGKATLQTRENFPVPRNVSGINVHLMPGSYVAAVDSEDISAGAIYDHGINIFAFGALGDELDDIGQSLARLVRRRFPDFAPKRILDLGCSIGHQSTALAKGFPDAQVDAIDVSEPLLRYGHARANLLGIGNVHFKQMNVTALEYPDASFDYVFSSMLLHELPLPDIEKAFAESFRVLKPGGLMLHYELPPNSQVAPYESFYLDWDTYYNAEPYFKTFRDQEPRKLCERAGFNPENYFQAVTPSLGYYGAEVVDRAIEEAKAGIHSDKAGRLSDGIQWFAFGGWKR